MVYPLQILFICNLDVLIQNNINNYIKYKFKHLMGEKKISNMFKHSYNLHIITVISQFLN